MRFRLFAYVLMKHLGARTFRKRFLNAWNPAIAVRHVKRVWCHSNYLFGYQIEYVFHIKCSGLKVLARFPDCWYHFQRWPWVLRRLCHHLCIGDARHEPEGSGHSHPDMLPVTWPSLWRCLPSACRKTWSPLADSHTEGWIECKYPASSDGCTTPASRTFR